jgi:hypothetical protein
VTLEGHREPIDRLAFSPDSRWLATASEDQTARVWEVATGQEIWALRGHQGAVRGVVFSPDGRRLATASPTDRVKVWDLLTGQETLTLGQRGESFFDVAFSPDGRWLAVVALRGGCPTGPECAAPSREVLVWDARTLTPDLRVQREAAGLVQFLFGKPLLRPDAVAAIRADRTIGEDVRDRALALAEQYPEDARGLHEACRCAVRRPGAAAGAYQLALRQAEAVCGLAPGQAASLTTRGMAQYRLGDYPAALETLSRAGQLPNGPSPANLAFLAMTQHATGRIEEAKATLERLRATLRAAPAADDAETQELLQEARARLQEAVKPPGP